MPHSQDPTTCFFSDRRESSPCPLPTSRRSILMLSSHLCLCIAKGLFQSVFPTKTLYTPFLFPICATCPTFLILRNLITRIIFGEHYRSLSFSLCNFLHSPVTSSHLCLNILLNTLFSTPPAYFRPSM